MPARPSLKAILFDMDDTLIDWSGKQVGWVDYRRNHLDQVFKFIQKNVFAIDSANREAFIDAAIRNIEISWGTSYTTLIAPHIGDNIGAALESVGVPADLIDREQVLHAYDWGPVSGVVAFPDVVATLPRLVAAGLTLGVITNSSQPMWMRDIELREFGLIEHLNGPRISAAEAGYLKPHPAIFQVALDALKMTPEEVVFVGDNPHADIHGAQGVGMLTVLRYLDDDSNRVHSAKPNGEITRLHELLPLLDVWYPGWQGVTNLTDIPAETR